MSEIEHPVYGQRAAVSDGIGTLIPIRSGGVWILREGSNISNTFRDGLSLNAQVGILSPKWYLDVPLELSA